MVIKRLLTLSLFVLMLSFLLPSPAQAYLDPGSGSFIVQILIAGLMGFLFMVKIYWKQIRTKVGNVFFREINEDD